MLELILQKIGIGVLVTGMTIANWVGVVPSDYFVPEVKEIETRVVYEEAPKLGGTFLTPDVKALFTTSLASKITSSATSMTLVSATDKDGNTLASSTYGFIIDEGTSVEEFVLADCTGTTCTNMTRGISVSTATTSVASLQFEHRRGASVKITTAPSLIFAINVLKGKQNLESPIRYASSVATTTIDDDNRNLVNYELLAYTAFNGAGVIDASATQKGVVELATQTETASSTANGSVGVLVIPASNATSTYNSATAAKRVVVTDDTGKIDDDFIPTTIANAHTFTDTVTLGTTIATGNSNIASTSIYATTTTGTWTKPSNLRYMIVEVVGGGGGGGGGDDNVGGGGGGGGYAKKVILASTVGSTETVTIGAGGAGGTSGGSDGATGGTSSFGSYISATGGSGGSNNSNGGGAGGIGSSGDINIQGGGGGGGDSVNNTGNSGVTGGNGGSSMLGGGGRSVTQTAPGVAGGQYGGGGGGAASQKGGTSETGGAGAAGVVIFTYVFY